MKRINDRTLIEIMAISGFLFILLVIMPVGCKTVRQVLGHDKRMLATDSFPAEIAAECLKAKASAVEWYRVKFGSEPIVLPVKVVWAQEPKRCGHVLAGAWTSGPQRIDIWVGQVPRYGSLVHEFRHSLCLANGRGGSEEVVR